MNTASRMESNGAVGAVHLSHAAFELAGLPASLFEARTLAVKGKAEAMRTYLIHTDPEQGRAAMASLRRDLAPPPERAPSDESGDEEADASAGVATG